MAEFVATALWTAGGAAATEAAIFLAANAVAINTVATIAATQIVGGYQKRKAQSRARAAYNAGLQDRLVLTATAQGARSRVYGRVRNVDGILFKQTHGADQEYYTWVVALAGHEVDAIEQVYFGDTPVDLDGDGYVTTAPWSNGKIKSASTSVTVSGGAGSVTLPHAAVGGVITATISTTDEINGTQTTEATFSVSGTTATLTSPAPDGTYRLFYQYQDLGQSAVRVRKYLGAASQDLSGDLAAVLGSGSQLTSADKFRGIAALLVTMRYSQDAFPTGVPSISAVIRGAKITDPRSGATAWSENPALIARDWLLYAHGGGLAEADLVAADWTAAANACDVLTDYVTPTTTWTIPLYQSGIAIPLDDDHAPDDMLSEIVEAMAGQWCWAGGQVAVRAGVYRAPVATITEDWITSVEDVSIVPQVATADLVNVMRPTIADAGQAYVEAPLAEVRSSALLAADGGVPWPREVTLGAVTQPVQAQHVCGVLMREGRDGLVCQLPCNMRAWPLRQLDVVAVVLPAFGWDGKLFEVAGWRFSLPSGVMLTLREIAAANYTPDAELDEMTSAENTGLPQPSTVPQVEGLTLTSGTTELADGTLISRLLVEWDIVASAAVQQSGSIEVQYVQAIDEVADGDWISAAPAPGSARSTVVYGLQVGVHYLVRARARNTVGVVGQWSYQRAIRIGGLRRAVTWFQDAEPSAGQSQDGDAWVDTNAGNRLYRRVGGAWAAVPVGTAAMSDGAATTLITASDGVLDVGSDPSATSTSVDEAIRSCSWTNDTGEAVAVQIAAGLTDGFLVKSGGVPSTARASMEWSSATLSGSVMLASRWPDQSYPEASLLAPNVSNQISLPAGETLTLNLRMQLVHDDAAGFGWAYAYVQITAIKR